MTEEATQKTTSGVADRLVELLTGVFGEAPPVTVTAWDSSSVEPDPAAPSNGIVVHVESRRAVRRLVWAAGESSIAKAYVAGELSLAAGDLADAVRLMRDYVEHASAKHTLEAADRRDVLRLTVQLGAVGPAPRGPDQPFDAIDGYLDVPAMIRDELPAGLADAVLGPARISSDGRTEIVYTWPDPLSLSVARWEHDQLVVDEVREVVTEERARLGAVRERLERQWDAVVDVVGEQRARLWQLSLVLVRDNLERRTVRAYEISGTSALS